MVQGIDVSAYFDRIGYQGPQEATLAVLADLHKRHPTRIAFEGLDPFLGRPVAIDPLSIQAKLVLGHRGGYCHEQNALFFHVLSALGFDVVPLAARVVWMSPGRSPALTHRLTMIRLPEGDFLADVGFGGQTYTAPLRLEPELTQLTSHGTYRVTKDDTIFDVQMRVADRWEPMYRFSLAPQMQADFEMANWFTSTHPRTRFTSNLVAARVVDDTRVNLLNKSLSVRRTDGATAQTEISGPEALKVVLEESFELQLPVPANAIWTKLPDQPPPQWP